jgi:NADH-quinone oxidoreductase subunit N
VSNAAYLDVLLLVLPETMLVVAALAALALDLEVVRREPLGKRWLVGMIVVVVGCLGSAVMLARAGAGGVVGGGMFVSDELTRLVKLALLVMTVLTVLTTAGSRFTTHVGEYCAIILLAAAGMLFLVSAEDLLMIFVALELTSLSLYVLAAWDKRNIQSAEAALKYFLFGGLSAAFTLFGMSLIYGLSGSTNLHEIAAALTGRGLDPLLAVAIVMTVIGFGFKVAVVPFHLWAPDAYQGAPAPSAAFIASGSKLAGFFIFAKVMLIGFAGAEGGAGWLQFAPGWMPVIATIAAFSMVLGNLAAIAQRNVKRLLAYSAIAHGGYALLGILANNAHGVASLVYYAVTYGVTVIGAFAVVAAVEQSTGGAEMERFAGLGRRSPVLAAGMAVFILSLAGIPPLAGFIGKFYLFVAAANGAGAPMGLLWLVILAVAMSAVSLYYYLQVLKQVFVMEPAVTDEHDRPGVALSLAVVMAAALVVVLGCLPDLLLAPLDEAIRAALIGRN